MLKMEKQVLISFSDAIVIRNELEKNKVDLESIIALLDDQL